MNECFAHWYPFISHITVGDGQSKPLSKKQGINERLSHASTTGVLALQDLKFGCCALFFSFYFDECKSCPSEEKKKKLFVACVNHAHYIGFLMIKISSHIATCICPRIDC